MTSSHQLKDCSGNLVCAVSKKEYSCVGMRMVCARIAPITSRCSFVESTALQLV